MIGKNFENVLPVFKFFSYLLFQDAARKRLQDLEAERKAKKEREEAERQ